MRWGRLRGACWEYDGDNGAGRFRGLLEEWAGRMGCGCVLLGTAMYYIVGQRSARADAAEVVSSSRVGCNSRHSHPQQRNPSAPELQELAPTTASHKQEAVATQGETGVRDSDRSVVRACCETCGTSGGMQHRSGASRWVAAAPFRTSLVSRHKGREVLVGKEPRTGMIVTLTHKQLRPSTAFNAVSFCFSFFFVISCVRCSSIRTILECAYRLPRWVLERGAPVSVSSRGPSRAHVPPRNRLGRDQQRRARRRHPTARPQSTEDQCIATSDYKQWAPDSRPSKAAAPFSTRTARRSTPPSIYLVRLSSRRALTASFRLRSTGSVCSHEMQASARDEKEGDVSTVVLTRQAPRCSPRPPPPPSQLTSD